MKNFVLSSILLFCLIPLVAAVSYRQSTTWVDTEITTNTTYCTSINQIGYGYGKDLGYLSWTNGSSAANCGSINATLRYGSTNATGTNATKSAVNPQSHTGVTNTKYVGACFQVYSTGTCDIEDITLSYAGGGAISDDTIEGLPSMGSDAGSFMKNLAPGIGAFILILGVFVGVAALIVAVVAIIKSKVGGGGSFV